METSNMLHKWCGLWGTMLQEGKRSLIPALSCYVLNIEGLQDTKLQVFI